MTIGHRFSLCVSNVASQFHDNCLSKMIIGEKLRCDYDSSSKSIHIYKSLNDALTAFDNYHRIFGCRFREVARYSNYQPTIPNQSRKSNPRSGGSKKPRYDIKIYGFDNDAEPHATFCNGRCQGWECYGQIDPLYLALTGKSEHGVHVVEVTRLA